MSINFDYHVDRFDLIVKVHQRIKEEKTVVIPSEAISDTSWHSIFLDIDLFLDGSLAVQPENANGY